jgi:hypothetical protein
MVQPTDAQQNAFCKNDGSMDQRHIIRISKIIIIITSTNGAADRCTAECILQK